MPRVTNTWSQHNPTPSAPVQNIISPGVIINFVTMAICDKADCNDLDIKIWIKYKCDFVPGLNNDMSALQRFKTMIKINKSTNDE